MTEISVTFQNAIYFLDEKLAKLRQVFFAQIQQVSNNLTPKFWFRQWP